MQVIASLQGGARRGEKGREGAKRGEEGRVPVTTLHSLFNKTCSTYTLTSIDVVQTMDLLNNQTSNILEITALYTRNIPFYSFYNYFICYNIIVIMTTIIY